MFLLGFQQRTLRHRNVETSDLSVSTRQCQWLASSVDVDCDVGSATCA